MFRVVGRLLTGSVHRSGEPAALSRGPASVWLRSFTAEEDQALPPFDASLLRVLVCPLSKKPLRWAAAPGLLGPEILPPLTLLNYIHMTPLVRFGFLLCTRKTWSSNKESRFSSGQTDICQPSSFYYNMSRLGFCFRTFTCNCVFVFQQWYPICTKCFVVFKETLRNWIYDL